MVGVFFAKVSALRVDGAKRIDVRALIYVLEKGGDMISRHTCERFGMISPDFPTPGEFNGNKSV